MNTRNKVLIAVFLAALILPSLLFPLCSGLLDTENHENRALAAFPDLSDGPAAFPSSFDNWFNDHLPFKNQLTKLHSGIDLALFNTTSNPRVVVGEEDWLFYNNYDAENPIDDILGKSVYTEEDLHTIRDNILAAKDMLADSGCDFVLMIPSNKETVYSEHLPSYLAKSTVSETRCDALVHYLGGEGIRVVYPKQELLNAKDIAQLYYKYDTHWNRLGGYVGFRTLCEHLGFTVPELGSYAILTDGPYPKDLAELAGMASHYNSDYDYHFDYNPGVTIAAQDMDGYTLYTSDGPVDKTVLLVHDSYYESMIEYFTKTFTAVIEVPRNYSDLHGFQHLIEEYSCDIAVMEVVERGSILLLHENMPY